MFKVFANQNRRVNSIIFLKKKFDVKSVHQVNKKISHPRLSVAEKSPLVSQEDDLVSHSEET